MIKLYQIKSGRLIAGLEINENGICVNCAPILRKWCYNKHINDIIKKCKKLGNELYFIKEYSTPFIGLGEFFV